MAERWRTDVHSHTLGVEGRVCAWLAGVGWGMGEVGVGDANQWVGGWLGGGAGRGYKEGRDGGREGIDSKDEDAWLTESWDGFIFTLSS